MIPLVDIHCHLLAAVDDGPRTDDEALAMCRAAYADGTRWACATAHQNESWGDVTPDRLRQATRRLTQMLDQAGVPLTVFPGAEVLVRPDIEAAWRRGELLSLADRGQYLLIEMPHDVAIDLGPVVEDLRRAGAGVVLAHPERHPELLHDPGRVDRLAVAGCLVQVSARSITDPPSRRAEQVLKSWLRRGVVHLLGSDGHSLHRRPPRMAAAYRQIVRWAGSRVADRVCSTNGTAILHGWPVRPAPPEPRKRRWLRLFG